MDRSGFDSRWLSELKAKNDIVSVIGGYMPLTRKGKNFWGLCPFHHEKTSSFAVNAIEQYYHCFGCNASGDVIRFVMEMENLDFIDAIKLLADKCGMTMPEYKADENFVKQKKHRERLLALTKAAARHYYANIRTDAGTAALKYLRGRGIDDVTTVKFGLGISLGFEELITDLKKQGFTEKEMLDAGVAVKSNKNGRIYDALFNRLIVPIINGFGDVIAFGGRVLEKTTFAKYKNTGDTLLFNKSENLYNLNLLKKVKQVCGLKYVIMVEGYMDVISMVQAGVENVVASMGTSLTVQQARLIKRYTDTVYISYDGDAAGQKATVRGLDILKAEGLEVMVLKLPEGLDPDEVIRDKGIGAYYRLIDEALPLTEYKLKLAEHGLKDNADSKAKYVNRALTVLASLDTDTERETYLKIVKDKSGVSIDTLKRELFNKTNEVKSLDTFTLDIDETASVDENYEDVDPKYYLYARQVLGALVCGKLIEGEELTPYFKDATHKALYEYVLAKRAGNAVFSVSDVCSEFPDNDEITKIISVSVDEKNGEETLSFNLSKLKEHYLVAEKDALVKEIGAETDPDRKKILMNRLKSLVACKR